MRVALAAAKLGQQEIALTTQRGKVLLERTHAFTDLRHAVLKLSLVERSQVVTHESRGY
jgi:hypothetical protein